MTGCAFGQELIVSVEAHGSGPRTLQISVHCHAAIAVPLSVFNPLPGDAISQQFKLKDIKLFLTKQQ